MTQRDKVKFYFERSSFDSEYTSSRLYEFFQYITDTHEKQVPWSDNYTPPFDISLDIIDFDQSIGTPDADTVHVFALPWMRPWLENDNHRSKIESINNQEQHWDNVVILADYSHESHVPGPIGEPLLRNRPWIEPDRYICVLHGLGHDNISGRSTPFKDIVSSWSYTSAVVFGMLTSVKGQGQFDCLISNKKQTDIDFLIPNRLGRRHRRELMARLDDAGMLENAEWSMVYPVADQLGHMPKYDLYIDKFGSNQRRMSRPWHKWSGMAPGQPPDQLLPMDLVEQSKVYVAVDTWVDYTDWGTTKLNTPADPTQPFYLYDVSEKIVKPFLYAMPGFLFARPGCVNRLRELGFWMPGDDYNDNGNAKELIEQLIIALKNYSLEQHEISEKLIHNRDLIKQKQMHFNLSRDIIDCVLKWSNIN